MPTCPNCGGNFDDTFQFCPHCGKPKLMHQESAKTDAVLREPSSSLDCPKCHRVDSVAKVSAIVQGGTHQINGQIPVSYTSHDSDGWHSGTSYESYHATQQSSLAGKLMSPEKPTKEYSGLTGFAFPPLLISPIVCILAFASIFYWPDADKTPLLARLGICLGAIVYGLFLFGIWRVYVLIDKPFKARHAVNVAAWEHSMSKWKELYYCSRDDCIFIPGAGFNFNISNLNDAIEWHPPKKSNPFFPRLF